MAINRAPKPIKGRPWILLAILLMTLLLMVRLRQCSAPQRPINSQSDVSKTSEEASQSAQDDKKVEFVEFL